MDSRARTLVSVLALAALLGLLAWSRTLPEDAAGGPEARPPATRVVDDRAPLVAPAASSVPVASVAPSPPLSRVSPAEIDVCGTGEDDPPFQRPSISELLQLRVAELNDRMVATFRASHGSAPLREGWHAAQDPMREDEALRLLASAPDRVDDGFDSYVAVLVVHAANALHAGDAPRAIRLSDLAIRAAPSDVLPLVIGAVAHTARHEDTAARDQFTRAFAIDPEEPAIALHLAYDLEQGADVRSAIAAFDAYLAAMPDDRDMARRRARLVMRATSFSDATTYTRGGLRLVAPSSLSRAGAAHVLDVVDAGLTRGAALLGVPRREELTIFVHPTRDAMRRATCVQGWAGAVFDGALETDEETMSTGGERALTHESFHASVHPAVPNVPTWLDEGLAQYVSGEENLAHQRSYELMVREHTWIPFASMNDAFLVIDDSADAGLAYHQALAMVEWLVERRGERGIRDAARYLIDGGDPSHVLTEAAHAELDGDTLLDFIRRHLASQAHAPTP